MKLFLPEHGAHAPPFSPPPMVVQQEGKKEVPHVERKTVVHLCPQSTATWRGHLRLTSRECKFTLSLVARAYTTFGQIASALHAIAILQVYQAMVLKVLHEDVPNSEMMQELLSATGYALQATEVTAQALGRAMSTLVIQV
ncbi:hypothetical protein M9458_041579, partial [Cirrhinus mrigala]